MPAPETPEARHDADSGASDAFDPRSAATQRTLIGSCLELAARAEDDGDVPVGAVVVAGDGTVLGTGSNTRERDVDPAGHAEINALREAAAARGSWQLADCTLAVTLEPCPMCAGAIVLSRIRTVIFGAWDEKAGASGSVFDILREPRLNHWVEVHPGVREAECAAQLRSFFADRLR